MLVMKLRKAKEFTEAQKKILEFFLNKYLEYNPKYASWLYALMDKTPEETNYKLDLSDIAAKWITTGADSGIQGVFSPLFPKTIFIRALSTGVTVGDDPIVSRGTVEKQKYEALRRTAGELILQFATAVHELYHMLQFKVSPVGYTAMRLVSLFTTIPYYLFPNASWMPTYRKLTEWDIEGQAEKHGDKAPNMASFVAGIDAVIHNVIYTEIGEKKIARYLNKGEYTKEEAEACLTYLHEDCEFCIALHGKKMYEYGKEFNVMLKELSGYSS